jgi:hypothetical protein
MKQRRRAGSLPASAPRETAARRALRPGLMAAVASSTSPYERFDGLSPIPDYRRATLENKMLDAICRRVAGTEIIIISEKAADVICDQSAGECAYVGQESEIDSAEPEALCCDDGATSSLSSSLMNCSDVQERVVSIQTAQAGTVMLTSHVCLKTYYVRERTGELRPITTKTYIVKGPKRDLLSGKALNRAGYRIILDEDPEESGVYAVNDGKICKSKSFAFMSEHSSLYYLKIEQLTWCFSMILQSTSINFIGPPVAINLWRSGPGCFSMILRVCLLKVYAFFKTILVLKQKSERQAMEQP